MTSQLTRAVAQKFSWRLALIGVLCGVVGGALGVAAGSGIGVVLVDLLHVSGREGGAGYFVIAIAILGAMLGAPGGIVGYFLLRGFGIGNALKGLVAGIIGILGLGALGLAGYYYSQPHLVNINGPAPQLIFEIRPPATFRDAPDVPLSEIRAELDTNLNVADAVWDNSQQSAKLTPVWQGSVPIYYRTSERLFVIKLPSGEDRIFKLALPADPLRGHHKEWSEWARADFIGRPGQPEAAKVTADPEFSIRYKVDSPE